MNDDELARRRLGAAPYAAEAAERLRAALITVGVSTSVVPIPMGGVRGDRIGWDVHVPDGRPTLLVPLSIPQAARLASLLEFSGPPEVDSN